MGSGRYLTRGWHEAALRVLLRRWAHGNATKLEARDRAGRFFRVDQQIQALSRSDLQAAADELLARLRAHTRRRLDDDVAVLLAELTLTDPAIQPVAPGQRPAAGAAVGAA